MAKRRKLEAPDPGELAELEARFRRETTQGSAAPIGAMAADAASAADLRDDEARAETERNRAQAEAFADAKARGLVLDEVPLDWIDDSVLVRDRAVIDEAELRELRDSISRNSLRLPVELFELVEPNGQAIYGLLSGYRRLMAVRQLYQMTDLVKFSTVRAVLRDPKSMGGRFAAMVEENEVRAELSHFERGRIAVIAAGQGEYASVEAAVDALFSAASKAKRSKVRSFALIFEELGDLLKFPEAMTERQGLRLAGALRAGAEPPLREALAHVRPEIFDEEWAAMEPALIAVEKGGRPNGRGGRPRVSTGSRRVDFREFGSGIKLSRARDREGYTLRLEGTGLDDEIMDSLMIKIEDWLSQS